MTWMDIPISVMLSLDRLRPNRVWLVSGVGPHMSCDHVASASSVRTLRTLVGLFAGVSPLVRRQVIRSREHLTTDAARVRFDARVESHVSS